MRKRNNSRIIDRFGSFVLAASIAAVIVQGAGIGLASASVRPRGVEKDYPYGQLVKDANQMKGLRVTDVSCIFQFDGITGQKQFLANYADASGYSDNDYDAKLPSAAVGRNAFQGDLVRIHGYILGYYSYTSQNNSQLTIPEIEVISLTVVGKNCA